MLKIPLADKLIERFKATFTESPEWAWQFEPSIPLIGRHCKPGRGLLVYASAENLNTTTEQERRLYFREPAVWTRYRTRYEGQGRTGSSFFPDVGIQPVNDGGLFAAALFVSERLRLPTAAKPRTFLEKIAVSNWCKFSIKSGTNRDYIGDLKKLIESLPYVVGELAELRPAVALLPRSVWDKPVLRAAMHGASPWTRFLPVPQFNATVVNVHLAKHKGASARLRRKMAGTALAKWMANLHGFCEENAWRYIAFLDEAVPHGR
jgi:hypothetical protein